MADVGKIELAISEDTKRLVRALECILDEIREANEELKRLRASAERARRE